MYDVIIVGGGLAGLYTAFRLPKILKILIVEKEDHLGGRVYTFHNKEMTVDAGAGRFHQRQLHLMHLIRALKLTQKMKRISSESVFFTEKTPPHPSFDLQECMQRVAAYCAELPRSTLIQHNYLDIARQVLSEQEVKWVERTFGYSAELFVMNAFDALSLFASYKNQFYVMEGGLGQVVDGLVERLKHVTIRTGVSVDQFTYDGAQFILQTNSKEMLRAPVCVIAIPCPDMLKMRFLKSFLRQPLSMVRTAPLCRIYCTTTAMTGGLKIVTDNDLRMVIPVAPHVVMASYTDGKYAKRWKKVHDEAGAEGVLHKLNADMAALQIRMPLKNPKFFYWEHGVGYWAVGADSEKIAEGLVHPFDAMPLYLCGENLSHLHQQWMEGALETADRVAQRIRNGLERRVSK
jgi:monoamine oxidase